MSLIFRIKCVHMKGKSDDEAKTWLEEKNLKYHYGNLKSKKIDGEGFTEYKQRSRTGKVDQAQTVRVKLDEDTFVTGEYRYPKFKVER